MAKNVSTSIQYITVFPKSKDRWKYYINDNFKDSHSINTDNLKVFINTKIKSPAIQDTIYMISKYFNFIVDIPNNRVYRLLPKSTEKIKNLKMKNIEQFLNPDTAKKEEDNKNKDTENWYIEENDNLLKKYVSIDDLLT